MDVCETPATVSDIIDEQFWRFIKFILTLEKMLLSVGVEVQNIGIVTRRFLGKVRNINDDHGRSSGLGM